MFCTKCGNTIDQGVQFCNKCGAKTAAQPETNQVNPSPSPVGSNTAAMPSDQATGKPSFMSKIIGGAVTIGIVLLLAFVINNVFSCGGGNQHINAVRDGHFDGYPNITIGRAFNNFYDNADWTHFENARGENIVRFTGEWTQFGITSRYEWDFRVEGRGFEVVAIRMNGIEQALVWVHTWWAVIIE